MALLDPAELNRIALIAITAVASDDLLAGHLVLKGGNALQLVHRIGHRASGDLDFSMEGDLSAAELRERLERALRDRFDSAGYYFFDFDFVARPRDPTTERWGGYASKFKVLRKADLAKFDAQLLHRHTKRAKKKGAPLLQAPTPEERLVHYRGHAGPVHSIDVSKYEVCAGKQETDIQGYRCFVYSPAMISAEKFRALCQQMPGYEQRKHPSPRARDFYDLHALKTQAQVNIADHVELVRAMFAAKDVPLRLLAELDGQREFHRADWDAVRQSVSGPLEPFDFYFDFVLDESAKLKTLWTP